MTRLLVFSLVGFLLMTLLGPLQTLLGLEQVVVDVPLITLLYMSLGTRGIGTVRYVARGGRFSGSVDWVVGLTVVALGYINDVLGGGPKGVHCFVMAAMFVGTLWASRHLFLMGTLSVVMVSFFASLVSTSLGVGVVWFAGAQPSLATVTVVLSQAVLTAAAAPPLIWLFRLIESRISPDLADRGSLCR